MMLGILGAFRRGLPLLRRPHHVTAGARGAPLRADNELLPKRAVEDARPYEFSEVLLR